MEPRWLSGLAPADGSGGQDNPDNGDVREALALEEAVERLPTSRPGGPSESGVCRPSHQPTAGATLSRRPARRRLFLAVRYEPTRLLTGAAIAS